MKKILRSSVNSFLFFRKNHFLTRYREIYFDFFVQQKALVPTYKGFLPFSIIPYQESSGNYNLSIVLHNLS